MKHQLIRKIFLRYLQIFINNPLFQKPFKSLAVKASIELEKKVSACDSLTDYVTLAFNFGNMLFSLTPVQIKNEITCLMEILVNNNPKFLLEVGTARGGTLFLLTRVAAPDAIIMSIDLPQGEFGGIWYPNWKSQLYKSFRTFKQDIRLIRADSHSDPTFSLIGKILEGNKLDFLFLDGDHTYEGVKNDFNAYHRLVRRGGLIAFHDIHKGPPEIVGGVHQFWEEIKSDYIHREIIDDHDQKGYGIGVLYV